MTLPAQRHAGVRLGLALGLLFVEYLVLYLLLAHFFDGSDLQALGPLWSGILWRSTLLVAGVAVACTATIALWSSELKQQLEIASDLVPPVGGRWLGAHLLAFGAFSATSALVLAGGPQPSSAGLQPGWLLLWLVTAGLTVLTLLQATLGTAALQQLIRGLRRPVLLALLFGVAVSLVAAAATKQWTTLAPLTLHFAAGLLTAFGGDARADTANAILQLRDFTVIVAPTCSGIEGMGLIATFLTGYLVRFRNSHRFPHALLILPLGVALAWLANSIRIALLMVIGAYVDPELASGAFHSMAGWLFFCALALALTAIARSTPWFVRAEQRVEGATENPTAAYCLPFLLLLGTGMLTSALTRDLDLYYPARVLLPALCLWFYRDYFKPAALSRALSWPGLLGGLLVGAGWIALHLTPDTEFQHKFSAALLELSPAQRYTWLVFRVLGSVLLVPIVEELAFRGFLQRRLLANDFTHVPQQRYGFISLLTSSAIFGSLHPNWLAGTLAGVAFSSLTYLRGRLSDAIVAHSVANAMLCIAALAFDRWDLW